VNTGTIPNNLLQAMAQAGASDLHASQDGQLWLRIHGQLQRYEVEPNSWQELQSWVAEKLQQDAGRDLEGSLTLEGVGRFRTHLYRSMGLWSVVIRAIPMDPPTLDQLGLPAILKRVVGLQRGLVLVTGATGSGKSTTLASLLGEINRTLPRHIVTIEDPVEFVHSPKLSRISQREVGRDTEGFASAMRSALREDPDVILVGEMRDPETMDVALKAAETGHLVFSTAHTPDAIRTISRLVAMFPPETQRLVRLRLADNLGAIISQRLVRQVDGKGRIAAMEIVFGSKSTADAIGDPAKTGELLDLVERSRDGQSFEMHLVQLYLSGVITLDEAKEAATNPADLERALKFGAVSQGKLGTEEDQILLQGKETSTGGSEVKDSSTAKIEKLFKKRT
jgi:twitching motility protein PilT